MSILQDDIMKSTALPIQVSIYPIPSDNPGVLYRHIKGIETANCTIKRIKKRLASISIEDFTEEDIIEACAPEFIKPGVFQLQRLRNGIWTYTTYDEISRLQTGLFFAI